jgi:hypothetical protein
VLAVVAIGYGVYRTLKEAHRAGKVRNGTTKEQGKWREYVEGLRRGRSVEKI